MSKKNWPLILGISLPIGMIVIISLSVFIPRLFVNPKYGFLYSLSNDYYYGQQYSVRDGKLVKNPIVLPEGPEKYSPRIGEARLFAYDPARDSSKEVSFEEALAFTLDPNTKSPDGYEIDYGYRGGGGFLFFDGGRDYSSVYIKGNGGSKEINLLASGPYYYGGINFLGWIID